MIKSLLRIAWLAAFLMGYTVLVGIEFAGLHPESPVIGFVRIWLPFSGAVIFCMAYLLPREPAVWALPLMAYLVPAAWFRQAAFADPASILIVILASGVSAYVFRTRLSSR